MNPTAAAVGGDRAGARAGSRRAIFVYGFVAWTGYASLTDWNTIRRVTGFIPDAPLVGLANYQAVFNTPRFWTNDVFASIVFTLVFVIGCIVMGLLLAILIDQHIRAESLFRSIFLFPMALSFVVTGTVWAWILNPTNGINVLLDATGIGGHPECAPGRGCAPAAVGAARLAAYRHAPTGHDRRPPRGARRHRHRGHLADVGVRDGAVPGRAAGCLG